MKLKIWMLTVLLAAGWAGAQTTNSAEKTEVESTEQNEAEDQIAELLKRGNDPFRIGGAANADLAPGAAMDATRISVSIHIKGILCLRNKDPYALVQVGSSKVQLVRKGDLLLMPQAAHHRGVQNQQSSTKTPKYLLVTEINKDCIMVAPRQRPQESITIR